MIRCTVLYDVRVLLCSHAMYFGDLREVGESFSSYNPGLGPRFLSIGEYNIEVTHRDSQHCSQYNSSDSYLTMNTRTICNYIVPTVIVTITVYTHTIVKSSIQNAY